MAAERTGVGFINQRDMGVALFGFIGYTIARPDYFKIPMDQANVEALCHVWRVFGYMLGIEDEFNLFQGDLKTIKSRSRAILRHIITPALMRAPEKFEQMSFAAMDGLRSLFPEVNVDTMRFLSNVLNDVPGFYLTEEKRLVQLEYVKRYPHYVRDDEEEVNAIQKDIEENVETCSAFGRLSLFQRCNVRFTSFYVGDISGGTDGLRRFGNRLMKAKFHFLLKYPVIAIWRFGKDRAYIDNSIMEGYLKSQGKEE